MEKDRQCRQEILSVQETVYKEVSTASQDEKSGNALLLPTGWGGGGMSGGDLRLPSHVICIKSHEL